MGYKKVVHLLFILKIFYKKYRSGFYIYLQVQDGRKLK